MRIKNDKLAKYVRLVDTDPVMRKRIDCWKKRNEGERRPDDIETLQLLVMGVIRKMILRGIFDQDDIWKAKAK